MWITWFFILTASYTKKIHALCAFSMKYLLVVQIN